MSNTFLKHSEAESGAILYGISILSLNIDTTFWNERRPICERLQFWMLNLSRMNFLNALNFRSHHHRERRAIHLTDSLINSLQS